MGGDAGELLCKFISFHYLKNETNENDGSKSEAAENFPKPPRTSKLESVVMKETEFSPAKSLAARETILIERAATNEERVFIANQEFLLSSGHEESDGSEEFLREKFD